MVNVPPGVRAAGEGGGSGSRAALQESSGCELAAPHPHRAAEGTLSSGHPLPSRVQSCQDF